MIKFLITPLILLTIIVPSCYFQLQLDRFFNNNIVIFTYTISSIIFSIVFSNISTYNYEIIKNYKLMNTLYNNIKKEKNNKFFFSSILLLYTFC